MNGHAAASTRQSSSANGSRTADPASIATAVAACGSRERASARFHDA
jgi:hypothetical protein